MQTQPDISIVVPVRLAADTIGRTLAALEEQRRGLDAEILAVVSAEDPSRQAIRGVRVIEVPGPRSVPQLRAEGVRAARGRFVVITEDHCLFAPGWLAAMLEIHGQREVAAVG